MSLTASVSCDGLELGLAVETERTQSQEKRSENEARTHLSTPRIVSPLFGTFIPIGSVCSSGLETLVAAKLAIVSLPELLGKPDEKSFGTADVAEAIRVLVLNHFTDELRAALEEPGERLVDVVHGKHDA